MAIVFRRNRENDEATQSTDSAPEAATVTDDSETTEPTLELSGPYDVADAPEDNVVRIDFGSVKIPGVEGMNINLEVDEDSDSVVAITIVLGEGGLQLQAFAAPRSGGFWEEVRGELSEGINTAGGGIEEVEGRFGPELKASVPAVNEDGQHALQNVRFVGVDGQRWMLRGVFLGEAAVNERAAEVFEDVFAGCIVERGNQPMAPGEMLPLRLPEDAVANPQEADAVEGDERPPLDPFERGPEITEVR